MSNYQPPRAETEPPDEGSASRASTEQRRFNNPGVGMQNGTAAANNTNAQNVQDLPSGPLTAPTAMEIKFESNNGHTPALAFKMKGTTPFKKAMDAYCAKAGSERKVLRFLFDGERVQDEDNPEKLEMEDGDVIEVHIEQIGGDSAGF